MPRPKLPIQPRDLAIVSYPAEVLRKRAEPVGDVDDEVRQVAQRMIECMREANGIGLAAPQVGVPWRMFVCDVPPDPDEPPDPRGRRVATSRPIVCIDPTLAFAPRPVPEGMDEGCLSLPNILGEVLRPPTVKLKARNAEGETFELDAAGLLARCIQHEHDHLDGILIIDKFTQRSRLKNKSAIRELERTR